MSVVALALAAGVPHQSRAQLGVVGAISVGQQAQGVLSMSDARYDNKPFQAYNFQCTAGLSFQFTIMSSWDNYALIFDPMGNVVARDDDSGGSLNARINYTCPMNGTYRLAVSVFSTNTTPGAYTMQVMGATGPTMGQPMVQPISTVANQIALGQSTMGQITAASPINTDGKRYALYQFSGSAGQGVQIDMQSNELDSYLILQDQNGNQLSYNDDGGGGLNARIAYTLPYSGPYRLLAMSFRTSGVMFGTFTLSLMGGGMAAQPMVQPMGGNASGVVGTIAVGQQAQGVLSMGDARYDNKPFQAYNFQCTTGLAFQLNILSSWDNYALIFDPMGNVVARDDDSGGSLQARINYTCPMNGMYRLAVSVFSTTTTPGQYTLQVTSAAGPGMVQPMMQPMVQPMVQPMGGGATIAPPGQMATIAFGQQLRGRLEAGDRQMQDSTFADIWMFQGTAGQTITIDLTTDQFDSYLQLLDGSGNRLAEDDDSGGNLNARITFTLPANAQYQIVVNNYGSSRRIGEYTLWVH